MSSNTAIHEESLSTIQQRLVQLTRSLHQLRYIVDASNPLPPWPTLHSTFTILLAQLDSIMKSLSLVASRFRETVVFPEGNFPARAEENLLTTLLRKKVDPSVEEWETEALVNDPAENDDEFREWAAGVTVQAREGKMIGGLAKSETLEQQQIHQTAVDNVLTFMTKGVS